MVSKDFNNKNYFILLYMFNFRCIFSIRSEKVLLHFNNFHFMNRFSNKHTTIVIAFIIIKKMNFYRLKCKRNFFFSIQNYNSLECFVFFFFLFCQLVSQLVVGNEIKSSSRVPNVQTFEYLSILFSVRNKKKISDSLESKIEV